MKVAIIGIGAIGSLWACKLHQQNDEVIAFTRDKQQHSLTLNLDEQERFAEKKAIHIPANDYRKLAGCNLILVTVKSTQVATAVEPLFSHLNPTVPIVFLHNGMGAVDTLETKWHALPLYLATTTQAAFKSSSTQVHHTGYGDTLIGPYQAHTQPLSEVIVTQLNAALPSVSWDDNIQTSLWKKLAVNCVINPMTALYQCKNGELSQAQYQAQLHALIQQCHQVMQADGQHLTIDELTAFIHQVIEATAQNYSSMYQDAHHQRPTEIDFITGFLLKKAQQYGIEVPEHQLLFQKVKQLEI